MSDAYLSSILVLVPLLTSPLFLFWIVHCSSSELCPNLQSNENSLEQCPMSLFELQCPFELSDQEFKTSMSICLGVPVTESHMPVFSKPQFLPMPQSISGPIFVSIIPRMHQDPGTLLTTIWLIVQLDWPNKLDYLPQLHPLLFREQTMILIAMVTLLPARLA